MEDQLAQRLELAASMMGFDLKAKVSIDDFYKRLAELVNLEKQIPLCKVVRLEQSANGRCGAIVSVSYGDSTEEAHLTFFFTRGSSEGRFIKVHWGKESKERANAELEKGMGIHAESKQSSGTFERPRASTGDADPTSHSDSGSREGEGV